MNDPWREVERKVIPLLERLADATVRSAEANEAIVRMADEENAVQAESPPPFCPHCNTINPDVDIQMDGNGKLADFIMSVGCQSCDNIFYVTPVGWICARTSTEIEALMEGGN